VRDGAAILEASTVPVASLEAFPLPRLQRLPHPLERRRPRHLSSFWTEEDVFDRMDITVEVHEEPTTHTVKVEKLKQWIKSRCRHQREEAKRQN
jgi:hypothetical protein